MLQLVKGLEPARYSPRIYIAASTDQLASAKAQRHERTWAGVSDGVRVRRIPRSREVGQSWASSVLTTAWACAAALWAVLRERPGCVLANGPGTCLPVCFAARVYSVLGVLNVRVTFVESIARTERLSMTGALLYHSRACDRFLIQWPSLCAAYPRAQCRGRVY